MDGNKSDFSQDNKMQVDTILTNDEVSIEDLISDTISNGDSRKEKTEIVDNRARSSVDEYGIDWSKTTPVESFSRIQQQIKQDISNNTESGIDLETVQRLIAGTDTSGSSNELNEELFVSEKRSEPDFKAYSQNVENESVSNGFKRSFKLLKRIFKNKDNPEENALFPESKQASSMVTSPSSVVEKDQRVGSENTFENNFNMSSEFNIETAETISLGQIPVENADVDVKISEDQVKNFNEYMFIERTPADLEKEEYFPVEIVEFEVIGNFDVVRVKEEITVEDKNDIDLVQDTTNDHHSDTETKSKTEEPIHQEPVQQLSTKKSLVTNCNQDEIIIQSMHKSPAFLVFGNTLSLNTKGTIKRNRLLKTEELGIMYNPSGNAIYQDSESSGNGPNSYKNNQDLDNWEQVQPGYVENDFADIHNQGYNSGKETVMLCSMAGKSDTYPDQHSNGLENFEEVGSLPILKRWRVRKKEFDSTVAKIVREHPLMTEDELLAIVRNSRHQIDQKISKGKLHRALVRLTLNSGYERFRYFVKG